MISRFITMFYYFSWVLDDNLWLFIHNPRLKLWFIPTIREFSSTIPLHIELPYPNLTQVALIFKNITTNKGKNVQFSKRPFRNDYWGGGSWKYVDLSKQPPLRFGMFFQYLYMCSMDLFKLFKCFLITSIWQNLGASRIQGSAKLIWVSLSDEW